MQNEEKTIQEQIKDIDAEIEKETQTNDYLVGKLIYLKKDIKISDDRIIKLEQRKSALQTYINNENNSKV